MPDPLSSATAAAKRRDWCRAKSKLTHYRQISDVIHERIHIYYPLNLIVDSAEFQRLRHIHQLAFSWLVFPSANHTRFAHSLGVYALADIFVKELAELLPELNITASDQLCVCIAALIHDLGHGPFSHFYDLIFLKQNRPDHTFCHEDQSRRLFRRMIRQNAELRHALEEFLDERDLIFIEELIDPPTPFLIDGKWQLKGRPIEKSFLYEIVSNKICGLDVDKFDYFLRDGLFCNVPIAFSMATVSRIRDAMKVLFDEHLGFHRLMFAEKLICEIRDAFDTRMILHERVYNHKTVVCIEKYMANVFCAADAHFDLPLDGVDGTSDAETRVRLSAAYEDLDAFLKFDDRILYLLKVSTSPELAKTRRMLEALERREFPRFICVIPLDNFENCAITENELKRGILESDSQLASSNIIVSIRRIHRGMGVRDHPMERIRIFDERSGAQRQPTVVSKIWYKYNTSPMGGKAMASVYAPYDADEEWRARLRDATLTYQRRASMQAEDESEPVAAEEFTSPMKHTKFNFNTPPPS